MSLPETKMLRAAKDAMERRLNRTGKKPLRPGFELLIFLLVFFIATTLQSVILSPFMVALLFSSDVFSPFLQGTSVNYNDMMTTVTNVLNNLPDWMMILQLFVTAVTIVACILYCRLFEKRGALSLGFVKKGAAFEYLAGLGLGLLLFGGAIAMGMATGRLRLSLNPSPAWGLIILYFFGYLVQGLSEEVLCRSYLMVTMSRRWPLPVAIFVNSLVFMLLHMGNPGLTLLAMVNLMLFGTFASLYTLRRGSIWGIAAIHSIWNFAQGNIFGISVSGLPGSPSVLQATLSEKGSLIHGGSFGMEGGIAVTIVLTLGCIALILCKTKKSEVVESIPLHQS